MASRENKLKANVDGQYYVDHHCISCTGCTVYSPNCFDVNRDGAFVKKQPENEVERAACEYARSRCPAKAIGFN